jgi:hypothetical protein
MNRLKHLLSSIQIAWYKWRGDPYAGMTFMHVGGPQKNRIIRSTNTMLVLEDRPNHWPTDAEFVIESSTTFEPDTLEAIQTEERTYTCVYFQTPRQA